MVKKAAEKLINQISHFEELEFEKSLNINKLKLKENLLIKMDQVMDIVKLKFIKKLRNLYSKAKIWIVKTGIRP